MTSQRLRVAVLDDYQDLSKDVVIQLRSEADISVFQDTILPSQDMEALVQRLQPYQVISTMRERTPFPSELIARLPSLEILLTTGMHNRGIDLEACRAKGIIVAGTPAAPLP
jgi:lactate dehydrogenase-like 2-hydroxyacid dehydrogenase